MRSPDRRFLGLFLNKGVFLAQSRHFTFAFNLMHSGESGGGTGESELERLKRAIDDHFRREMEIAQMILEADLTDEEWKELQRFIRDHEWSKFVRWLEWQRKRKL